MIGKGFERVVAEHTIVVIKKPDIVIAKEILFEDVVAEEISLLALKAGIISLRMVV